MKNIIILLSFIVLSAACNDFLDPKSNSEIIPDNVKDLNELLLGEAYPRNSGLIYMDVFLSLLDDDIEYAQFIPEENIAFTDMIDPIKAAYTWQKDMFETFRISTFQSSKYNIWQNIYRGILGCNAVLDYISKVSGTEKEKNHVKAQALALRAFYYFHLVNVFGQPYNHNPNSLSVPLKLDANVSTQGKARNSVAEVYDRVVKDLVEAERLFTSLSLAEQWKLDFRTSLPMVQLLLSRVYLYMENWKEAARYGEAVIANNQFRLLDLNDIQTNNDDMPYFNFMSYYNNSEIIWLYGQINDAFHLSIFQSITVALPQDKSNKALFKASSSLINLYDSTDLRINEYILDDYSENYKIPMGKIEVDHNRNTSSEGFARCFKLAEAYLNTAEAYAHLNIQGQDATAATRATELLEQLKKTRFNVGTHFDLAGLSPQLLLEATWEERRRELCFEGHRWFDLRRQGMPTISHLWWNADGEQQLYTLEKNAEMYTLPIPEETIIQNPDLEQ